MARRGYKEALDGLYGHARSQNKARSATISSKGLVPYEEEEQIKFAQWLAFNGIRFYAIPNGGSRNAREGLKLKRSGVSRGVPDICIPLPAGTYHGLYIELKRITGGKLSKEQVEWLNYLREKGYYADYAHGFQQGVDIVLHYLSLT